MRIEDYESVCDVTKPAEVETALSKRHGAGRNAFWLSHGSMRFPALCILVNGDLSYVLYFSKEGHPGFASVGNLPGLRPGEDSDFFAQNSDEPIGVMNETVVPFWEALKAAQEFANSATMPKSIRWDSLVDGE
jgi:hypothetical protein